MKIKHCYTKKIKDGEKITNRKTILNTFIHSIFKHKQHSLFRILQVTKNIYFYTNSALCNFYPIHVGKHSERHNNTESQTNRVLEEKGTLATIYGSRTPNKAVFYRRTTSLHVPLVFFFLSHTYTEQNLGCAKNFNEWDSSHCLLVVISAWYITYVTYKNRWVIF